LNAKKLSASAAGEVLYAAVGEIVEDPLAAGLLLKDSS
jgi:hypothetical protein